MSARHTTLTTCRLRLHTPTAVRFPTPMFEPGTSKHRHEGEYRPGQIEVILGFDQSEGGTPQNPDDPDEQASVSPPTPDKDFNGCTCQQQPTGNLTIPAGTSGADTRSSLVYTLVKNHAMPARTGNSPRIA